MKFCVDIYFSTDIWDKFNHVVIFVLSPTSPVPVQSRNNSAAVRYYTGKQNSENTLSKNAYITTSCGFATNTHDLSC